MIHFLPSDFSDVRHAKVGGRWDLFRFEASAISLVIEGPQPHLFPYLSVSCLLKTSSLLRDPLWYYYLDTVIGEQVWVSYVRPPITTQSNPKHTTSVPLVVCEL